MLIYRQEVEDGLSEVIKSNASLAYTTKLEKWEPTSYFEDKLNKFAVASNTEFKDLYPVKSILVTTNWNGNDDVFGKEQTWAAKNSPLNKPSNINHNEKQLIGHITDVWAMDLDGNVLEDSVIVSDLPDVYHLVTGSVIYTHWNDDKFSKQVTDLIDEIESGDKYVSMECVFSNFSYALISPDDEYNIVQRTDKSSFLTKHLRAYGGTGKYENYKVGRLLENIVFSGKGFVDNPANPESIILNKSNNFKFSSASTNDSVYINRRVIGENNMSEFNEKIDSLEKENKELKDQLAKADVQKYLDEIAELKKTLESKDGLLEDANASIKNLTEANEKTQNELKESNDKVSELNDTLDKIKHENVVANRVSKLVDNGIEKSVAEEKVKLFDKLNDEQFDSVASEIIESHKVKAEANAEPVEQTETPDDNTVLDTESESAEANLNEVPESNEDGGELQSAIAKLMK